ncbi:MAG: bifunctional phosphopantothenoylcysteine decarboxylase/phosphopantothenate--cysteine ligase CoaBC [bacterium]|nr:bifunctional phosphopantothenoylcysteine decarboxylase/phosphopantothenate--cysteine ligase CoaBC [bacterium]
MSDFEGKTVLVGVTGCIAAYKSCEIVRALQKAGAKVQVVMTEHATEFVGPATFRALTREPVGVGLFDDPSDPIHHISLAKLADVFLIAPATANVVDKLAKGIADDLLTTTALATTAQLVIAPAMNVNMWRNEEVQKSVAELEAKGARIVNPTEGYLACGDEGEGKLADVDEIVAATLDELRSRRSLAGKSMLITSGPTYEPIDPVRFIGNKSSGLTGVLLAQEAARRGANVTLVIGPNSLKDPLGVDVKHVTTALEMFEASKVAFEGCDVAIFSAAVADFRPATVADTKIKKRDLRADSSTGELGLTIELVENPDILRTLAANKGSRFVVGYAAETVDLIDNAKEKLAKKNADLIVANDVSSPELGFGTEKNRVFFVREDSVEDSGIVSKREIARQLLDIIAEAI